MAISNKILLTSPQKKNSVGKSKKLITKFEKDFLVWIEAISNKILLTSPKKKNSVGESKKTYYKI